MIYIQRTYCFIQLTNCFLYHHTSQYFFNQLDRNPLLETLWTSNVSFHWVSWKLSRLYILLYCFFPEWICVKWPFIQGNQISRVLNWKKDVQIYLFYLRPSRRVFTIYTNINVPPLLSQSLVSSVLSWASLRIPDEFKNNESSSRISTSRIPGRHLWDIYNIYT